jgi:hypothetical protein
MRDIIQVGTISGGTLAVVNFTNIKDALSCLLIAVTIGYTLWKWRRDASKHRK